ncbi:hypothetical protein [Pasteurella atlantica]|nr:hypothetical protein [Pasteurella atlantica]MDP8100116.1 hypothetical protein [Pasteurella atlantica]MDP8107998.1 hypothetical protein [Pasteurella atlantica]MDP8117707.1 hypothetical protein [Pasteurella atlantica]
MHFRVDEQLRNSFASKCQSQDIPVSVVLRELMKSYLNNGSTDNYDADFYAHIDKALQSPILNISEDELFTRLRS